VNSKPLRGISGRQSSLSVVELYQMIRDYVKQETLDPLRGVGRWLAWGIIGAVALIFGAVVGLIGLLRLLQAEIFSQLNGFTWIPYLIVVVAGVAMIWLSLTRIQRPSLHRES
jgi:uncharacterized membrane protein YuzA (DUF378 family)